MIEKGIFDAFCREQLKKQPVVKTAQQEDKKEEPKLSEEAVAMLYGYTPEKNIIDQAHPETALLFHSYDAMNAVVENVNERQNIMAYIAMKQPDATVFHRRYVKASQELGQALVRAGFALDAANQESMMKMADFCAQQLQKKAISPLAAVFSPAGAGIAAGAGALAGLYYLFYGATAVQNVKTNAKLVLSMLTDNDYIDKQPYSDPLEEPMRALIRSAQIFEQWKDKITAMAGDEESLKAFRDSPSMKKMETFLDQYEKQLEETKNKIPKWVAAIELQHAEKQSGYSDWYAKIMGLIDPLYFDSPEKLVDRLEGQENLVSEGSSGGLAGAVAAARGLIDKVRLVASNAKPIAPEKTKKEDVFNLPEVYAPEEATKDPAAEVLDQKAASVFDAIAQMKNGKSR